MSVDQTWEFLKKLKLATEMKSANKPSLYVPSLIPEKNQIQIIKALEDIKKSPNSLGFYASFPKSDAVTDLYSKLLCRLASNEFFYKERDPGIRFNKSFSAKIENRTLGVVAGTKGSLLWEGEEGSGTIVDFILVEIDCDNTKRDLKFARDKVPNSRCACHIVINFFRVFVSTFEQGTTQRASIISTPSKSSMVFLVI